MAGRSGSRGTGRAFTAQLRHAASTAKPPVFGVDLPDLHLRRRHAARASTPGHYAYVKIAEGCDYKCAFCIIPKMRGHYRSRPIESIVAGSAGAGGAAASRSCCSSRRTRPSTASTAASAARCRGCCARSNDVDGHRVDPAALPLPDDHHRRRASTRSRELDKVVQVHRPAAAARLRRGAEADEAARHARSRTSGCSTTSARAFPTSRCARRSSSASPARPRTTSPSSQASSRTVGFDHVGVFTYSHEEGTSAHELDDDVPAATKQKRQDRLMARQKRHRRGRASRRGSANGPGWWSTARPPSTNWSCTAGCPARRPTSTRWST